jgi:PKHD-type hydroxylase
MIYQVPPRNNFGIEHSAYWDGFLSEDDLNYLLYHPNWKSLDIAQVGSPENGEVNSEIRKTEICWIGLEQENSYLWDKIANVVAEVNRRFFHLDLTGFYEPMQLGLYRAGEQSHYTWHTDNSVDGSKVPRKLSMALSLSDPSDYQGGELQIKPYSNEEIVLENKKGRAWFFPSYTLHRVTPVTVGVRKSLVLWVGGPQFK